jgi:hypothetical protein
MGEGGSGVISVPYDEKLDFEHNYQINGAVLDPDNPSHFTIQVCYSDGTNNPINGYLDNDDRFTISQKIPD